MSDFNIQGCLRVADIIVHLNFLLVGLYFIYHGEIFPRFLKGRTQFAEFEEDITELPTILTFLEFTKTPMTPLSYGPDLNISLQVAGQGKPIILTLGNNTIHRGKDGLRFDEHNEFSSDIKHTLEKRQVRVRFELTTDSQNIFRQWMQLFSTSK